MEIILASSSPRRKELLEMLGLEFKIMSADVDESIHPNESPFDYVYRLAINKAKVIAQINPQALVIGGDVTVDIEGESLQKAETDDEAKAMISKLSGKTHYIRDAYAVYYKGELFNSGVVTAQVRFKDINAEELTRFIATKDWVGKAGAYAIQGRAQEFVNIIIGSYFDIIGLPISQIAASLLNLGFKIDPNVLTKIYMLDQKELARFNTSLI